MTKVYEIYVDAFKYAYSGFWTSIEEAVKMLPENPRFQRAMEWNKPYIPEEAGVFQEPDYEHNKKLKYVVSYNQEKNVLEISLPGYKINRYTEEKTPEVKEEGKPYSPAKTTRKPLDPIVVNHAFKVADVHEIELNCMKSYY